MEETAARPTPSPMLAATPIDGATIDRRRKELRDTIRAHHRWYERAKSLNRNLFYGFQVLSLISGFGAAALAAIELKPSPDWLRPALILLPLLASTFASLIHQFSWRELYELRERWPGESG
ncbi:MAG: hypothetical protein U1E21_01230 [Reyranellaceae bacterium]